MSQENPMSYFSNNGNGIKISSSQNKPSFKKKTLSEQIDRLMNTIIGMSTLKEFLSLQKQTLTWNERRRNSGMSEIKDHTALILSGSGDKEQAIKHLAKFYKIAKRIKTEHVYDLDLETESSYWPESTRRNFEYVEKDSENHLIVVRGLSTILSATSEEYEYTRYYTTKFLTRLVEDGRPIIILASRQTLRQWRTLCENTEQIRKQVVPIEKYSADDLTQQFFHYADSDGYIYTHALQLKIRDIFQSVHDKEFRNINTNNLAKNVYQVCQKRQCQRLWKIHENNHTDDAMRSFTTDDIVRFIVPCARNVMIV